ncbi:MAG: ABC transporter permease [Candidatus Micrarchaeota archaeon]
MFDLETIKTAVRNLRGQGFRSNLTVLGIVLGITAIIALISLGEGLTSSVQSQFESLGTDTLIVLPGKNFTDSAFVKLQSGDVATIQSVRGVDFAAELAIQTVFVEFKGEKKTIMAIGLDADKMLKLGGSGIVSLGEGRYLNSQDKTGIMIGPKLSEEKFKRPIHVTSSLGVNGKKLKVVGTTKESANTFVGGMFDEAVIMNIGTLETVTGQKVLPNRVFVKLFPGVGLDDAKDRISRILKRSHSKEDFQVLSAKQVGETAGSVIGLVQVVLVGIALISLLVGAVGIMNTMFMSVSERTKEIGIMKAIGATDSRILSIFITEAILLGLVGGVIGTVLGIGLAKLASIIATLAGFELPVTVSLATILFAVGFSMLVGLLSGILPAKTAAELDPVDAIRFGN